MRPCTRAQCTRASLLASVPPSERLNNAVALQEVDRALNDSNIAAEGLGDRIAQLYFQLAALDGWEPELPLPAAPLLKPQQPTGPLPPLRHASDVSSMGSEVVVVDGDEDPEFEPPGDAALAGAIAALPLRTRAPGGASGEENEGGKEGAAGDSNALPPGDEEGEEGELQELIT